MQTTASLLQFGDNKIVAGANWIDFPEKERSLFKRNAFMKRQMQASNADLWSPCEQRTLPFSDEKAGRRQHYARYAMFNKSSMGITPQTIVGALAFSEYLEKSAASLPKSSIYVLICKLPHADNSEQQKELFWTCAVNEYGVVQYDYIFDNEFMVLSQASSFITYRTHIVAIDCDNEFVLKAESSRDEGEYAITTSELTMADWISCLKLTSDKKRAQPKAMSASFQHGKSVGIWSVIALMVGGAYTTSSYLSQQEAIDHFSNKSQLQLAPKKELLSEQKKTKNGTPQWDKKTFDMTVKSQFSEFESKHPSSPAAVIEAIYEMSAYLPAYLNEFRFSKISYSDGQIFVHFIREPKSNTVFYFLDESIKEMNQHLKNPLKPFDLQDKGNIRIYSALVVHDRKVDNDAERVLAEYHDLRSELAEISTKIKSGYKDLSATVTQFESLSWDQIIFEKKPIALLSDFRSVQSKIQSLEKQFDKKNKQLLSIKTSDIEDDKLIGQVMDFVTMMQLDDKFTWNHPVLSRTFPDKKSVENNGSVDKKSAKAAKPQKTKSKKKKQATLDLPVVFRPVLESYLVEIVTNEDKDVDANRKITSFGSLDLIQLKDLINKPFIHILDVQYDMMSSEWVVKVNFTRKRPEFNSLMSQRSAP